MSEPLVLDMSFSKFDVELGTNPEVWREVYSRLSANGGHVTIVLNDRTLYDVTAVLFNREQVSAYASLHGIRRFPDEDDWDFFWRVVEVILSNSDYDGYLFVPPEVVGTDFGAVLFYRSIA